MFPRGILIDFHSPPSGCLLRSFKMSMEEAQNILTVMPGTSQSIPFYLNRLLHSFLFYTLESRGEIPVKGGSLVTLQNFKF
jgi:hypothetical protein